LQYLVLILILLVLEYLFIFFATKFNIIDNPNDRSSHSAVTVRGGGVIFWFAALAYFILYFPGQLHFFAGITIVAILGFTDDLKHLNQWFRIAGQLLAVTIIIISPLTSHLSPLTSHLSPLTSHLSYLTSHISYLNLFLIITAYIIYIGILNAYNFMDGINGITGMYSISVLGVLQYINIKLIPFTETDFIWFPMMASIVFLFFNFRKKALCFAGDVGSLTIAFWIVYLILLLVLKTNSVVWILLLAVYGIDSVLTILHRLLLKQNIFDAHRLHFYQVLANERGLDHRIVSSGYAVVQAVVSVVVIGLWDKWPGWVLGLVVLVPLAGVYGLKFRLLRRSSSQ
jgi:UDP-N-acetylmuramyl pentapeptide phosphotransferase/UDP-N-acetylglucosamine-1-phosphate transferase